MPNALTLLSKMVARRRKLYGQNVTIGSEFSPHRHFRYYIMTAWLFSTGVGTILLLLDVAVVGYALLCFLSPLLGRLPLC